MFNSRKNTRSSHPGLTQAALPLLLSIGFGGEVQAQKESSTTPIVAHDPKVDEILKGLMSSTPTAREDAYYDSRKCWDARIDALLSKRLLESESREDRFMSARALGHPGQLEVVPTLLSGLDDSYWLVRKCSAQSLLRVLDPTAKERDDGSVIYGAGNPDITEEEAKKLYDSIRAIPLYHEAFIKLKEKLFDESYDTRSAARRVLCNLQFRPDEVVGDDRFSYSRIENERFAVLEHHDFPSSTLRENNALGIEVALELSHDPFRYWRDQGAFVLGKADLSDAVVREKVIDRLQELAKEDSEINVRAEASYALGRHGDFTAMRDLFYSEDPEVRARGKKTWEILPSRDVFSLERRDRVLAHAAREEWSSVASLRGEHSRDIYKLLKHPDPTFTAQVAKLIDDERIRPVGEDELIDLTVAQNRWFSLPEMGDKGIAALLNSLDHPSSYQRGNIVAALDRHAGIPVTDPRIPPNAALSYLTRGLRTPDNFPYDAVFIKREFYSIVDTLQAKIDLPGMVEALQEGMRDDVYFVRVLSAAALGPLGGQQAQGILEKATDSYHVQRETTAFRAVTGADPAQLIVNYQHEAGAIGEFAHRAREWMGFKRFNTYDADRESLLFTVSSDVVQAFGRALESQPKVRDELTRNLTGQSGKPNWPLAALLANTGEPAAVKLIAEKLTDPRAAKKEFTEALQAASLAKSEPLRHELLSHFENANRERSTQVFETIAQLTPPERAMELLPLIKSDRVRYVDKLATAIEQLGESGHEEALKLALAVRDNRHSPVRKAVIGIVAKLGPQHIGSDETIKVLSEFVKDSDSSVARRAVEASTLVSSEDSIEFRLDLLRSSSDPRIRTAAAVSLRGVERDEVFATLSNVVSGEEERELTVRKAALTTLTISERFSEFEAIFQQSADNEESSDIRQIAIEGLKRLSSESSLATLIRLSTKQEEQDPQVRKTAVMALKERNETDIIRQHSLNLLGREDNAIVLLATIELLGSQEPTTQSLEAIRAFSGEGARGNLQNTAVRVVSAMETALCKKLAEIENSGARVAIIEAISGSKNSSVNSTLSTIATNGADYSSEVRNAAVDALASNLNPVVLRPVLESIAQESGGFGLRFKAARLLGTLPPAVTTVSTLTKILENESNSELKAAVTETLGIYEKSLIDRIATHTTSLPERVRAAKIVTRIPTDSAFEYLLNATKDEQGALFNARKELYNELSKEHSPTLEARTDKLTKLALHILSWESDAGLQTTALKMLEELPARKSTINELESVIEELPEDEWVLKRALDKTLQVLTQRLEDR